MLGLKTFRVWFGVILLTLAISGEALSVPDVNLKDISDTNTIISRSS